MNQHIAQDSGLTHIPVMITEVLSYLAIQPDGVYLDGITTGLCSHTRPDLRSLINHQTGNLESQGIVWFYKGLETKGALFPPGALRAPH